MLDFLSRFMHARRMISCLLGPDRSSRHTVLTISWCRKTTSWDRSRRSTPMEILTLCRVFFFLASTTWSPFSPPCCQWRCPIVIIFTIPRSTYLLTLQENLHLLPFHFRSVTKYYSHISLLKSLLPHEKSLTRSVVSSFRDHDLRHICDLFDRSTRIAPQWYRHWWIR